MERTRTVTLQELPKSKYVQVFNDLPANARVNYDNDDDAENLQLPIQV